jgi:hypothetical protein
MRANAITGHNVGKLQSFNFCEVYLVRVADLPRLLRLRRRSAKCAPFCPSTIGLQDRLFAGHRLGIQLQQFAIDNRLFQR